MLYIYPYKLTSGSARALRTRLSEMLGYHVKLVRPDGRFRPRRDDRVINFGNSNTPSWKLSEHDLNFPDTIKWACNKLEAFKVFKQHEIPTPEFTEDQNEAQEWVNNGSTIVVRHILTGHSGQGAEVVQEGELPHAPLYTKYKKKRAEYRVHVFGGQVIDTQQKRKSREDNRAGTVDTFIRSHHRGWVFCRDGIVPDNRRDNLAIQSVQALGLDFGGVDIIYNEHEDKYYTLEVNTAPGLEGETLNKYVHAILQQQ